jgi:hypothetical protein
MSNATTCAIERGVTNDLLQEAKPRMTEPAITNVTSPARALFHTAPRCVDIREVPTPRPSAGEILVHTLCAGISGGTERLVYGMRASAK